MRFYRCYNCHELYNAQALKGSPPKCRNCRKVVQNLERERYEREQYKERTKGLDLDDRIYSMHPRKLGRSSSYRVIPPEIRFIERAVFRRK